MLDTDTGACVVLCCVVLCCVVLCCVVLCCVVLCCVVLCCVVLCCVVLCCVVLCCVVLCCVVVLCLGLHPVVVAVRDWVVDPLHRPECLRLSEGVWSVCALAPGITI